MKNNSNNGKRTLTLKDIKKDPEIMAFIKVTEKQLEVLGFTEHSVRHLSIVANWAGDIMREIGGTKREVNLAEIAGYLHDLEIGQPQRPRAVMRCWRTII